ncbi:MAG: CocE/NonD family hydrolase [Anaerolineae bacterium]|nr:CocE/NonD family hydrolase [Anaerolineae bacterium]
MAEPRVIVERDVAVPMRDGVILRANVYRPDEEGRFPVLLQRTPYGKDASNVDFCVLSAARGYAVVVQDTRGRWASEGVHYPLRYEFDDGYDTVEWAASQPWANGKVGMWGGSYVGWTQWTAAFAKPPSLVTIFPMVTFTDAYTDVAYPGGALAEGIIVSWGLAAVASMVIQRMEDEEEKAQLLEELADALDGLATGETFRALPLSRVPLLEREDMGRGFQDFIKHLSKDAFWDEMDVRSHIEKIAIPVYHLGGWYDIFVGGTLASYQAMRERAGSEKARRGQKLIMGPWLHGPLSGVVGEVDFGVRASDTYVLPYEIMWRWFDYWLKGVDNGIMDEPPVRIFVMGQNRWRTENEWPLARTAYTPYYLHSGGKANSLKGDGVLSLEEPGDEPVDQFSYDPRNPVPTRGGGLCCWQAALPAGAYDQRPVEEREDVLVYTSAPLEKDLEVTGPLQVVLWASSSAVDTDFTAKLVDVSPCGYARNLADGIVRARYRHGVRKAQLLTPGAIEKYVIDLGATSNVFLAGHRIRLEISSSNFPRFERNPNTGHPVQDEGEMIVARQKIYHDAEHPSQIILPIVPPKEGD